MCDATQPNCVTNERGSYCSATRNENCPIATDGFICTSVGRFPDPDNCRLFYNCDWNDDETKIVAEAMICRAGEVVDLSNLSRDCRLQANARDCPTIRCTSTSNYIRFSPNFNYYGLCIPNSKTIMFNCPESNRLDITVQPPRCTFVCPRANGRFKYSLDVFRYYECFFNTITRRTESELKLCPRRQEFNPSTSRCESSTRPSSTTSAPITTTTTTTAATTTVGSTVPTIAPTIPTEAPTIPTVPPTIPTIPTEAPTGT